MKSKLNKVLNSKFMIFLPFIVALNFIITTYNENFYPNGDLQAFLLSEFIFYIIITFIYFGLSTLIIYFITKDYKKVIIIEYLCALFINFYKSILILILINIILTFIILVIYKKISPYTNSIILGLTFVIIPLFILNISQFTFNIYKINNSTKIYNKTKNILVDNNLSSPNIHCDGMLNLETMNKYFNYQSKELKQYLNENNFIINKNTSLIAGHRTHNALVALFNPYFYDNFLGNYLNELEQTFLNKQKTTSFRVDYKNMEDKRLNNELFKALEKKGYKTIVITELNEYSSLNANYIYDFHTFNYENLLNRKIKYIANVSDTKLKKHIDNVHFIDIGLFLHNTLKNYYSLDYELLDYQNFNVVNYPNINESKYKTAKGLLKSINHSQQINKNNSTFTFIDFNLNHYPIFFNQNGDLLKDKEKNNIYNYVNNYKYCEGLLKDLIQYIKDNDSNSIIFLQADHGIHTLNTNYLQKSLNIKLNEVATLRNSTFSAYYIPLEYKTEDEKYLNNPLNISRYIINNYVGQNNFQYLNT